MAFISQCFSEVDMNKGIGFGESKMIECIQEATFIGNIFLFLNPKDT